MKVPRMVAQRKAPSPEGAFGQALGVIWRGSGGILVDLGRCGGDLGDRGQGDTEGQRWPGWWHRKRKGFKPCVGVRGDFEEAHKNVGGIGGYRGILGVQAMGFRGLWRRQGTSRGTRRPGEDRGHWVHWRVEGTVEWGALEEIQVIWGDIGEI